MSPYRTTSGNSGGAPPPPPLPAPPPQRPPRGPQVPTLNEDTSPLLDDLCDQCLSRYRTIAVSHHHFKSDTHPCSIFKQECSQNSTHSSSRYVCLSHPQKGKFKNLLIAKQHVRRQQKLHASNEANRPVVADHQQDSDFPPICNDVQPPPVQPQLEVSSLPTIKKFLEEKIRQPTLRQFILDEHEGELFGSRMLVKRAFGSPDTNLPSVQETYFHLLMSSFLLSLTETQRETFYTIVKVLHHNTVIQCRMSHQKRQRNSGTTTTDEIVPPKDWIFHTSTTRLPTSRADFLQFYLNKSTSYVKPTAQTFNCPGLVHTFRPSRAFPARLVPPLHGERHDGWYATSRERLV